MRLDEAITEYLDSLTDEGRSPRTVDAYMRDLRLLVFHLGPDADVGDVTPPQLLAFARSEAVVLRPDGEPRSRNSTNRTRSAVRGLFGFLVRLWVIRADPSRVLRIKAVKPPRPRVLSMGEEVRLLEVVAGEGTVVARRDSLMIRVLLGTGIRLSSLVAMNVEDLDSSRLWIRAKGERVLAVEVPEDLAGDLLEYVQGRDIGPVWLSARGRRLGKRQVQARLAMWVKKAGIKGVGVHDLRRAFATRLYDETRDLRAVQRALGHRSLVTAGRYVGVV